MGKKKEPSVAKFSNGDWLMDCTNKACLEHPNHLPIITMEGTQICLVNHNLLNISIEEYDANAKIIAAIPEMYKLIVTIAYEEGWQDAYDALSKALGKKLSIDDVTELYKNLSK